MGQSAADPNETAYLEAGSLLHRHGAYMHYADGSHSDPNLVTLLPFAHLFEFFLFYIVHASMK